MSDRVRGAAVRPSPVFLGVLAVALLGGLLAWRGTGTAGRVALPDVGVFLFVLAGWVAVGCVHEFAHALAAWRAGDRSVEAAGYLTLNPVRYAHPVLSLLLPLVFIALGGIGLPGGAVYLHPGAFRTRAGRSLASAVGPLTNLVAAVVLLWLVRRADVGAHPEFWSGVAFLGLLQVTATVLNLLPVPGLDGFGIIEPYLAPQTVRSLAPFAPYGMIAIFVLLQVQQLNTWFFDLVYRLYDLTGAPRILAAIGYEAFRFWRGL